MIQNYINNNNNNNNSNYNNNNHCSNNKQKNSLPPKVHGLDSDVERENQTQLHQYISYNNNNNNNNNSNNSNNNNNNNKHTLLNSSQTEIKYKFSKGLLGGLVVFNRANVNSCL